MASKFVDSLVNQANRARAWFFATMVFALTTMFLAFQLASLASNIPVRLVPYNFSTMENSVEVRNDGLHSNQYLAHIAVADIKLFTDWTDDTVKTQFLRLQTRMSPKLKALQSAHLTAEASQISETNQVQFLVIDSNPQVRNGFEAKISGQIMRWDGSALIVDEHVSYRLSYIWVHGVPYVQSLTKESIGNK
ncbi:MAG: hypothetical protein JKY24_08640 [Pseudomonadales bacterium]|nr:hypothetical protein [Pseudomonadales bacterium]